MLTAIEVDLDVGGQVRRHWLEAETGELRVSTLEHALNFSYYYGSNRVAPISLSQLLGWTVCTDPTSAVAAAATAPPPGKGAGKWKRTRAFFDAAISDVGDDDGSDDEEEDKASAPPSYDLQSPTGTRAARSSVCGTPAEARA